jgi:Na+/melibiose symporter-like transporter
MSGMFFGTNALLTKPAQSFAPIITFYVLSLHGYRETTAATTPGSHKLAWSGDEYGDLRHSMLTQAVFLPLVLTVVQLMAWTLWFTLNADTISHLKIKKREWQAEKGVIVDDDDK